jgi:hypothetical protein
MCLRRRDQDRCRKIQWRPREKERHLARSLSVAQELRISCESISVV